MLADDFLNALQEVLYFNAAGRMPSRGENTYGRSPRRAEVPVRSGARARRVLVVPLRGIEEPAVLRRHAQDHRVYPGQVHGHQGRESLAVRLQAYAQPALLRRHPQDAADGSGLSYFLAADQRPSWPPSV